MKIQPGPGAPTQGTTQGSTQLSLPRNQGGTIIASQHPNNFRSQSRHFQGMNQFIVYLDALYKTLPLTGPGSQALWEAEAIANAGIHVCGCADVILTGQALFRMANYYGALFNQPIIRTPNSMADQPGRPIVDLTLWANYNGLGPGVSLVSDGDLKFGIAIVNCGLGLENPIFIWTPGTAFTFFAFPDQRSIAVASVIKDNGSLSACNILPNLMPGLSYSFITFVEP